MKYTKEHPLKVIELFSGIGAQRSALEKAGIPHKVVAISEIDKFALKSYNEMYNHCLDSGETINLGDITKINPKDVPDCDFMTYSFPCTDISSLGHEQGLVEDTHTRSSLLWECRKLIKHKKPKYLMLENVKMLLSKKNKPQFNKWLATLDSFGYNSYYKVLNAKDFGMPQNRERVFVISIRKDIDDNTFSFYEPFPLQCRLGSMLESNVDNKFYLKYDLIKDMQFIPRTHNLGYVTTSPVANLNHFAHRHMNCVFNEKSISPTLTTMQGGNTQPKVLIKNPPKGVSTIELNDNTYGVRKLTPKECWRLMGFSDSQFEKAESVCSNTQLYKQAGNSIVVDVMEYIFKNLFKE